MAYRAIHNALAHLRLSAAPVPPSVTDTEALRLYAVVDRVHTGDAFARAWSSFDRVQTGEVIGMRHDGAAVRADSDGYVVFPNPRALPGQEWFYLARSSTRL